MQKMKHIHTHTHTHTTSHPSLLALHFFHIMLCYSHIPKLIHGSSIFEHDATSLAHKLLGSFSHLSSSIRLDGSVGAQPFSDLSRDAKSVSSPAEAIPCYLGCVFRVVVLLEDELSPQSEVQSTLEQVFIKDVSVHCSIHLSAVT